MAEEPIIERIADPVGRLACRKCGEVFDVGGRPMFSAVDCPACGKAQTVPGRLDGFLVLECLGRGGMASVYRAYDETLGRMVAIKVLRRMLEPGSDALSDFLREARAAAQLNHRNIVQVYTVGQAREQPYLVMELLDGGRLDQEIAAERDLSELRVLEIARGVVEGLSAANQIGLVHGDIKPANILFDRAGTPKIADFGLAQFKGAATARGEIWGTPYYIAPEKVRRKKEDHRSDIYSLGATLYHALGGKPPFEGRTATDVVVARLKEPPIRIQDIRPSIHPATAAMIGRMLEPDPFRRYPTHASLLADLDRTIARVRADAAAPPPRHRRRRIPWPAVVAGAVVLAVSLATVVWLILRWEPDAPRAPVTPPPIGAPAAPMPPDERVPPVEAAPLQPFSEAEGRTLGATLERIGVASAAVVDGDLVDEVRALERGHPGRPWYALWYAVPRWIDGERETARTRLRALRDFAFDPQPDGTPHPGALPQALAHLVAGETYTPPAPEDDLPEWYRDLAGLFEGMAAVLAGRHEDGRARLAAYAGATGEEPPWAYALKPAARRRMEHLDEWEQVRGRLTLRIERGEGARVIRELQRRRDAPEWAWLRSEVETALREARSAQAAVDARQETERRSAEEEARLRRVAAERTELDEVRAAIAPRIRRLDLARARAQYLERTAGIETVEARADRDAARELLDQLVGLKRFLALEVGRQPYPHAQRELRGTVVQAGASGIRVALPGGVGEAARAWDRVPPAVFADMITYYLPRSELPEAERGLLAAGLTVFFELNEARPAALVAARNAVRLNPEVADALRRFLPEVMEGLD